MDEHPTVGFVKDSFKGSRFQTIGMFNFYVIFRIIECISTGREGVDCRRMIIARNWRLYLAIGIMGVSGIVSKAVMLSSRVTFGEGSK